MEHRLQLDLDRGQRRLPATRNPIPAPASTVTTGFDQVAQPESQPMNQ
jgi:hypothetical protein